MDAIMTYDLHFVIKMMRSKRTYAPATIKHVILVIERVCNWAGQMDFMKLKLRQDFRRLIRNGQICIEVGFMRDFAKIR